jgi:hypothetical protein
MDISAQAKQKDMMSIMVPTRATSDETLADRIESWDADQIDLLKVDPTCELRPPVTLSAFKNLLPEKVLKHVDEQMDSSLSDNYEKLRQKVYGWALKKRVEAKDAKGKARNVDQVNQDIPNDLPDTPHFHVHPHDHSGQDHSQQASWGGGQEDYGWYDDWGNWIESMGKGKGAFKGGKGGKYGGKGGKYGGGKGGKGKFTGNCHNCGKPGHKAADCRVNVVFNRGKGGKGKGGKGGF